MRISDWSSDVCSSDLGHADAPHGLGGDDAGEPALALLGRAELAELGAHLAVGEPRAGDGCTLGDEGFVADEALEGRSAAAAEPAGPRHAAHPPGPAPTGHGLLGLLS